MEERTLPKLLVSREEAEEKIQERIDVGKILRDQSIDSDDEYELAGKEAVNWSNYNKDLLVKLFGSSALTENYRNYIYEDLDISDFEGQLFIGHIENYEDYVKKKIYKYREYLTESLKSLEGIRARFELFEEPEPPERIFGDKIFIVHGHDEAAKHKIARFIEDLELTATILDEQPSRGQTIIDKFEEHADEAGFAIVLLTSDDLVRSKDNENEFKHRARQNVILELGYFLHALGRERVRVLHEESVEIPSDIHGIVYVPLDSAGGWKINLGRELQSVGYSVDMNNIL
ncbi:MAG: nucleotide-binding protein [Candidatus Poribacteria bacterium]|nr:nucleotide-binding protein [Candidatus Poribacteria bacterium]